MKPTDRQRDFLRLKCEEALYGGAAGGGKSEALLIWLAEGIAIPSYSGIIFRRTYKQLEKSNDSLVAKSQRLYRDLGGRFNITQRKWTFPSGATIEMGALEHLNSIYDYQGNSYHRIAFDELTQFQEAQYLYLFSRKRSAPDFAIRLGVRASANPGGVGHDWVKKRFITEVASDMLRGLDYREKSPPGLVYWPAEDRAFVPARLADNPFLAFDDYVKSLHKLSPVDRERLLNGDWTILENAMIKTAWLRYYSMRGDIINLELGDGKFLACDQRECTRFITIDPAGTSEDRSREAKGKNHSYTVAGVWDQFPQRFGNTLILRHVWRKRVDFPDLLAGIRELNTEWRPSSIRIENEKLGEACVAMLMDSLPISTIATGGKDKVTRATKLLNMLEKGQVFLPNIADEWRTTLESEWLSWRGLDTDVADQVDMASYAAIIANNTAGGACSVDFDFTRGTGAFSY
jgi:phage terminase large subunit-like protein